MPELPEVESIRLQLEKYLVDHVIKDVEIRYHKCFQGSKKDLIGGKVKQVRRFGKVLVIDLDNRYSMLIHVRMTGQLIYKGPNLKKVQKLSEKVKGGLGGKHTHVIFHLDYGGKLYYNDVRKFGWIKVAVSSKLKAESKFLKKLGPEPVIDKDNPPENPLTLEKFATVVQASGTSIKSLLMDQKKIAGVGNIYANDALWLVKINPTKVSKKLGTEEIKKLFKALEKVLKEGIKRGGASEIAFITPDGTEGNYQDFTLVYGKERELCLNNCGGKIKKIKISGRGTYYCPNCQKL
ncbi:DNA-formamidopyrimidine glycosylase [Candidatus Woesebacteria bacterium RBG_16_34_12]|uniref:DNA-formamidopyrimidine glycosylase n=1 Tax=Candidatus Woesebacteria bacterium RBG_16_34_12 TaxID=1802480 RepID=A0A1F7XB04_9BACT|nr:MAG: DNA-formamidopyrimidine glycosylase [Candidatus Woesebacteria bacterium RBG_16_34_12]